MLYYDVWWFQHYYLDGNVRTTGVYRMSNKFAWEDEEFINRPENIALRMQMELHRPYQVLRDAGVKSTVSVFGSARISKTNEIHRPLWKWLDSAEEFSYRVTKELSEPTGHTEFCITTGAGPAIMEYANKGAHDAGGKSIGMSISLPFETHSNQFVDPEFDFVFKYFSLRKFHMCKLAKAIVVYAGGIGSLDELSEVCTLSQTGKMPKLPIILFGTVVWSQFKLQLQLMEDMGLTSKNDFDHMLYTDSTDEGIQYIKEFYKI